MEEAAAVLSLLLLLFVLWIETCRSGLERCGPSELQLFKVVLPAELGAEEATGAVVSGSELCCCSCSWRIAKEGDAGVERVEEICRKTEATELRRLRWLSEFLLAAALAVEAFWVRLAVSCGAGDGGGAFWRRSCSLFASMCDQIFENFEENANIFLSRRRLSVFLWLFFFLLYWSSLLIS